MSSAPLLQVRLQAGYGKVRVLEEIAFDLHPGEALGLIGTSGAGKSTLVMALLGLLSWRGGWATGQVLLDGMNLLTLKEKKARGLRGSRFALVPQSPLSALNGALSLRAHFEQAWKAHAPLVRVAFEGRVRELLDRMHLPDILERRPGQISVGQAQRVLLALALLHRPSLLIADEPTSALDPVTQAEIMRLLRRLNRDEGTALLYISHDLASVLQLCGRIAVLHQGRVAECLDAERIEEQARHGATRAMLQALPAPPHVLRTYSAAGSQPVMEADRDKQHAPTEVAALS